MNDHPLRGSHAVLAVLLATAALTGCAAGLPRPPTANRAREWIVRQELPAQVDLIIVHGCPARDDGAPSTCNQRRARAAVEAWRRGLAPRVMFTGGTVLNRWAESEVMARYARVLGLPEAATLTEVESRHTVTNLSVTKGLMKRRGWTTSLLVSEAMHLVWAKQLADFYGMKTWLYPADPLPPYPASYWETQRFDRYEPWRAQTAAYGTPRDEPTQPPLSITDARRVAVIVVPDFASAAHLRTARELSRLPGVNVQTIAWSSYATLPDNARLLRWWIEAWTRGFNGSVGQVIVIAHGWGGVIAAAAAGQVRASNDTPVRMLLIDAPLRGERRYANDWSRTRAPLRWVMHGSIRGYDPPAPHVRIERVAGGTSIAAAVPGSGELTAQ